MSAADPISALLQARSDINAILQRLEAATGRTVVSLELQTVRAQIVTNLTPMIVGKSVEIELSTLPSENWRAD